MHVNSNLVLELLLAGMPPYFSQMKFLILLAEGVHVIKIFDRFHCSTVHKYM